MGRHLSLDKQDEIIRSAIQAKNWQNLECILKNAKEKNVEFSKDNCRALFNALASYDNEINIDIDEVNQRKKIADALVAMNLDHLFLKGILNHLIRQAGECQMQQRWSSGEKLSASQSLHYYIVSQIVRKLKQENFIGNFYDSISLTYETTLYGEKSIPKFGLNEFNILLNKANKFFSEEPIVKFSILSEEFAQKLKEACGDFEKSNDKNERKALRQQALSEFLIHLKMCIKTNCLPINFHFSRFKKEPIFSDLLQPKRPGLFASIVRFIAKIFYISLAEKMISALEKSHKKKPLVEAKVNKIRDAYGSALAVVKNIASQTKAMHLVSLTFSRLSSTASLHSLLSENAMVAQLSNHTSPAVPRTTSASSGYVHCQPVGQQQKVHDSYSSPRR